VVCLEHAHTERAQHTGVQLAQRTIEVRLNGGIECALPSQRAEDKVPGKAPVWASFWRLADEQVFSVPALHDTDQDAQGRQSPWINLAH
jgi:hypothetical protein